ncbi:DNA-directed RNA polymerase subunit K [Candidatus Pacearchaeota archaeon]|nr:DNA-directed RNA polymerase subunit K [Candidatus Pacearchaeota archaeon]
MVQSIEDLENKFTKYEIARILGARSLQLAMDAPVLLKMSKAVEEEMNFDTLKISEKELVAGVLPITVRRPLPKKSAKVIKKLSEDEIKEKLDKKAEEEKKIQEKEKIKQEANENSDIVVDNKKAEKGDEIMEMANPDDEVEEEENTRGEIE